MPETAGPIPLEGFDPLISRLANIEDLLTRVMYATAHADVATAPTAARPEPPHIQRRRELKRDKANAMELRLIPGGDGA
ncbi:hypothetical protein [Nocardia australiensis]|uniref:hypothetical protein n=1 Tax=Nocardia australiensis TaxID=2887191 RepID=UPI001D13DFA0|nr:hypothetical protein [Nocardia australiensis]